MDFILVYIILERAFLRFSEEDTWNWAKFSSLWLGWWKYTWCHFKLWVCEVRVCFNFREYDQPAWMFRSWATTAYKIKSPKKNISQAAMHSVLILEMTASKYVKKQWWWSRKLWRGGGTQRLHLQRNSCSSSLRASGVPREPSECKVRLTFIYCIVVPICIYMQMSICIYVSLQAAYSWWETPTNDDD